MRRALCFAYGVMCYAIFLVAFVYLIAFLAGVGVPKGIDAGLPTATWSSVLIDCALIVAFGLQHSLMARPAFKKRLAMVLPASIERSTYVLAASLVLILLYWQWRPLTVSVWTVDAPLWRDVLWALLLAGFGIVLASSFVIDHFDLFGLRQVWLGLVDRSYRHPTFRVTYFYKFVRHPIYCGLLLGIWSTPHMTAGHLLFALGMSIYIGIGIHYEERDLERFLGDDYRRYRARVPMLVPTVLNPHETVTGRPPTPGSIA